MTGAKGLIGDVGTSGTGTNANEMFQVLTGVRPAEGDS